MTDKVAELIADATAKRETALKKDLQKAEESFERCKDKLKLFEELQIDPETDSIETQIAKHIKLILFHCGRLKRYRIMQAQSIKQKLEQMKY